MKEKILHILNAISLKEFGAVDSFLSDQDVIQGVVEKGGNIGFAINIGALGIDKSNGEKLITVCEKKIRDEMAVEKVTIVLTSHDASAPPKVSKNNPSIASVPGVKKIIAIASAKGGVGKSTIASNLAVAMQKDGCNVALLDADIYGPSIPHLMNLKGQPKVKKDLMIPLMSHGVKCISIGSLIDANSAGVWRGPMITKILHQLIRGVNWTADAKEVDVMIIDMPPGTGDVYLSLAEKFPLTGVVMVSTPQALSVIDVVKSVDCFKKLHIPILGLIQNMSYLRIGDKKNYVFGKDGAKKLSKKMNLNFLGEVPILQEISDFSEKSKSFTVSSKDSQSVATMHDIARMIKNA